MSATRSLCTVRALALLAALAALAAPPRAAAQATPDSARAAADSAQAAPALPRVLVGTPAGDTLGTLRPGTPLEVVGREGEWARVRVEGWIRVPPGTGLPGAGRAAAVSLRALREDPERYRGRSIAWEVQFVALQTADSLRVDLTPGERYMLARDPGGEPGLVYVVVPPAMLDAVRRLGPLQRVRIVGRVRAGRSELTGHPVLELLELRS